jgi:CheY-like chemotaxis protein
VLVVEDNLDSAASLSELLGLWGYPVQMVHDGYQALTAARQWRPEVILLDIGLPGIDGYEVARRLRREPATTDVLMVALTGYGGEEERRRAQQAGFNHHLTKPVELESLQALLREAHAA